MPIKLPKGFSRRKSSGNALEEVENPPQSSFRVFERSAADRKSFSDVNLLTKNLSEGHPLHSPTEESDNIFAAPERPPLRNRDSAGNPVNNENSPTIRFYKPAITRSSTDVAPGESHSPHSRGLHDIPPLTGALRAAGRTFSFGGRLSRSSAQTPPPQKSVDFAKNRASTGSTASTATPPRLLDADLNLGKVDNDFQNMLNDFGKEDGEPRYDPVDVPSRSLTDQLGYRREDKAARPAPIDTDRSKEVEPSPYSWDSRHSEEGLLHNDSGQESNPNSPPLSGPKPLFSSNGTTPAATTAHRSLERPKLGTDRGLRRSMIYSGKRASTPIEDEDAKLIMESLYSGKAAPLAMDHEDSDENETSLFENGNKSILDRPEPREPIRVRRSPGPDPSIAAHARLAARYEQNQPKSTSSHKVMTPSQFEHYRQQQELRRSNSDASKSEDSAESDYDDEDEAEKNREAERQRRKQEAHLTVYRQQMMKVTGQQSPAPSLRPEMDRASNSTPNLTTSSSNLAGSGKSSEEDDDEEIPLGILAAHGFPNRNRPPTRLTSSNSIPNLRGSYHQQTPGLSPAEHDGGNRASLPAFARNLPRDPYYGASLVNPSNRESLALGGGSSARGGSTSPLPPGGLVGVIATEERARAIRRGSPNTQAAYEYQNSMLGMNHHGTAGGIPRPYTMMNPGPPNPPNVQHSITPTEQAQIQLSQQMASMMQMQMQWMQQMVHMQGGQAPLQPQPLPHQLPGAFPNGMPANSNMRPASMPSATVFNNVPAVPHGDHRTLSMLDPNVPRLNGQPMPYAGANRPSTPAGPGYAPSIAPSERSNVGMAPRYRPVSTLQQDQGSAYVPSGSGMWNDENQRPIISVASPSPSNLSTKTPVSNGTLRPISSGGRSSALGKQGMRAPSDDEDDEEGWAEMMKKREKKRNDWKTKRETSNFGDLLNVVH